MSENWKYITPPAQSFAGLPVCTQLDELEADIAIIGLHYVSPYPQKSPATKGMAGAETAPDAIRRQSSRFIDHQFYWHPGPQRLGRQMNHHRLKH